MKTFSKYKYGIIMPYYNRAGQLQNTLVSFGQWYAGRDDVLLIIVEDIKTLKNDEEHDKLLKAMEWCPVNIDHIIIPHALDQPNPAPKFNQGAQVAYQCDYLILTNPECIHMSNILEGLDDEFEKNPDAYVICGCASSQRNPEYIRTFKEFEYQHKMWYQHSVHNNRRFHFCTAIRRFNYMVIGGFDEAYADGLGYDDNDLRDRVDMGGFFSVLRDDLLVVHCWHPREHQRFEGYKTLLNRNKNLYELKQKERSRC